MQPLREFENILDRPEEASRAGETVSVADIRHRLGDGAFGPALFLLGLICLSPIGDIPGMPSLLGIFVILIAGQLLAGRDHFWLPGFLVERSVNSGRLRKAIGFVRPVARFLGKVLRPRLAFLTQGPFARAIGALCILLALTLPFLEVVPFGATVPSAAITLFALALIARDGLLASAATLVSGIGIHLVATTVLL